MLNVPYDVKKVLKKGRGLKNYKFEIYGDELVTPLFTIDNNNIVAESVKIDDRMCSEKVITFGLCEGASLEFQYFGLPAITNKHVKAILSIACNGEWYDIPMGWFLVDQCPMQFSTGIYKVTAFNKLKSDYLDAKANSKLLTGTTDYETFGNTIPVFNILYNLLGDYGIYVSNPEIITSTGFGYAVRTYNISPDASIRLYSRDGSYVGTLYYYWQRISISFSEPLSADEFYQLDIFGRDFNGYLQRYLFEVYDDGNFYRYSNYRVGPGGKPLYEALADGMEDFSKIRLVFPNPSGGYTSETISTLSKREKTKPFKGITGIEIICAGALSSSGGAINGTTMTQKFQEFFDEYYLDHLTICEVSKLTGVGGMEKMTLTFEEVNALPDVTLRELQSAVFETKCQYGQLDRTTDMFSGVELNGGGLYPADTLYPEDTLYPNGTTGGNAIHPFPSSYQKLWTDAVGVQKFKYLIITYKAVENGTEVEKKLQRTVNADGTTNYNMSSNWLFRNLVWTAEQVGEYADIMVQKMRDITWFPFEMWCTGLPYVDTGDAIEIADRNGEVYTSYVLQRTLTGVQNLQDAFANGELDIF